MTDGLIVEPVTVDFDVEIPITINTKKIATNTLKIKNNFRLSRAELEAHIKQLIEVKNLDIHTAAEITGFSQTTIRRICRTLRIGPYLGSSNSEFRLSSFQVPFGWNLVLGKLEKNSEEWKSIKLMNDMRHDEKNSFNKIAVELTRLGIHTKNGGIWHAKTIYQILKYNEKFLNEIKLK